MDVTGTTASLCLLSCKNGGACGDNGICICLPGYYGDTCQQIGYDGYSTIGAIAGAVICIVFLLLLTCMAFAAHIRGPRDDNQSARITRLVSVEARGNSFDENAVLARNVFPPEYSEAVRSGRGRRLSSLRFDNHCESIDETESRSPPPVYEIIIFGKKRKFSFRRGSKSQKSSEITDCTLDNTDCIIEEVTEKFGDDSVFTNENTVTDNTNVITEQRSPHVEQNENVTNTQDQQEHVINSSDENEQKLNSQLESPGAIELVETRQQEGEEHQQIRLLYGGESGEEQNNDKML